LAERGKSCENRDCQPLEQPGAGKSIKMSLLGKAALVMWHGVEEAVRGAHDDWHSHEHLAERLALPGFRRGRRCVSPAGEGYFLMYEVEALATLTSPAYLDRLNDPSPWSREVIPSITGMSRTLCRVLVSEGTGVGGWIGTRRFSALGERREEWVDHLARIGGGDLASQAGLIGFHLLEGDSTASARRTEEKKLREREDETADLALLVEGYEREAVEDALRGDLGIGALRERGGAEIGDAGLYQTAHVVSAADISE